MIGCIKTLWKPGMIKQVHKQEGKNIKKLIKHTRRAIFLSLFIAQKCFKRDNTAESSGLSGATVSSTIHGWPDTYFKDIVWVLI